jgi:hypothetical protein
VVIIRMPSAADCRDGGGMIDSTFRNCISPAGTVRLREHVVGHLIEFLPLVLVVVIVGGVIHHRMRTRRSSNDQSPPSPARPPGP